MTVYVLYCDSLFVTVHVFLQQYMLCIVIVLSRDSTCFIATVHFVYCDSPFCESTWFIATVLVVYFDSPFCESTCFIATVYVVYFDSRFCESTFCIL